MFFALKHVVTAFFVRPDLMPAAKIGRPNPWADAQQKQLSAPFTNFGVKSPFPSEELDPLFIIEAGDRPLGFSRVFDTKRLAVNWVVTLVENRDVYSYWRNDAPVGPFGRPDEYKRADQFVDKIAVHAERTITARGAAEAALNHFKGHFDEPLFYWDRTARGAGVIDQIKKAIATPGWV